MKRILVTTWSIWIYKNNVILSRCDAKPAQIINLAVKFLNEVKYYNTTSSLFGPDYSAGTYTTYKEIR